MSCVDLKPYVGDVGTLIIARLIEADDPSNILDATVMKLQVSKPETDDIVEWTASLYSDGKQIQYNTQVGDFDIAGWYNINAYIETPAGIWTGEPFQFEVFEPGRS